MRLLPLLVLFGCTTTTSYQMPHSLTLEDVCPDGTQIEAVGLLEIDAESTGEFVKNLTRHDAKAVWVVRCSGESTEKGIGAEMKESGKAPLPIDIEVP